MPEWWAFSDTSDNINAQTTFNKPESREEVQLEAHVRGALCPNKPRARGIEVRPIHEPSSAWLILESPIQACPHLQRVELSAITRAVLPIVSNTKYLPQFPCFRLCPPSFKFTLFQAPPWNLETIILYNCSAYRLDSVQG